MVDRSATVSRIRKGISISIYAFSFASSIILSASILGCLWRFLTTGFKETYLIFLSLAALIGSILSSIIAIRLDESLTENIPAVLPAQISKQELQRWSKISRTVVTKAEFSPYISMIVSPYFFTGGLLMIGLWLALSEMARAHYLDFLLALHSVELIAFVVIGFFILLMIAVAPLMLVVLLGAQFLARKYLKYPKEEEVILAHCLIMANNLKDGNRLQAQKQVGKLKASLTRFLRDWFNPRRKAYADEFNILRNGRALICRMLLFDNRPLGDAFVSFGLALARGDDPSAYTHLKEIVSWTKGYGESASRTQRILNIFEKYPRFMEFIVVFSLLAVAVALSVIGFPELASLFKSTQ